MLGCVDITVGMALAASFLIVYPISFKSFSQDCNRDGDRDDSKEHNKIENKNLKYKLISPEDQDSSVI